MKPRRLQRPNMYRILLLSIGIMSCLSAAFATAEQTRRHSAHRHGVAQLNVAADGGDLYIELNSPAANILGFEHAPSTATERAVLDRAIATLKNADRLFALSDDARCRIAAIEIELPEDADDRHDHHTPSGAAHTDILGHYRFNCADLDMLRQVDTAQLFATFPATQRLELQYAIGDRQGAAALTESQPALRF